MKLRSVIPMEMYMKKKLRTFKTGANRDTDYGKFDYEAFFSPLVLERRAKYMHKQRFLADGSFRDGDNWQKGMPLSEYMKSKWRHHHAMWMIHRGYKVYDDKTGEELNMEDVICADMFNDEGYLHELLKKKNK